MALTAKQMTAEDLLKIPKDGFRHELIRGELIKMTPSGGEHGKLAMEIGSSLHHFVKSNNLGFVYAAETGFKIRHNPDTVRAPDVAFVNQERAKEIGETEGYIPGAPDLAVEVISPNDVYTEVEGKVLDWLNAGTRMIILVNPRKNTVTIYRSFNDIVILTEEDEISGDDVVQGWKMSVKDLFK